MKRTGLILCCALLGVGCGGSSSTPTTTASNKDAITYMDDLSTHPGCSVDGQAYTMSGTTITGVSGHSNTGPGIGYTNATIAGYPCAAKEYVPAGTEDTTKPIVILIHGNADDPTAWEKCNQADMTDGQVNRYEFSTYGTCTDTTTPMLSETLTAAGYHAFAVDVRFDLVPVDFTITNATDPNYNAAQQFNHGWAVPIAQSMVTALYNAFPNRKFVIVGHSLGVTIGRDLLRRMYLAGLHPYDRLEGFVGASGGNHGIAPGTGPGSGGYDDLCGGDPTDPINKTIRGLSACELGSYKGWTPSYFQIPISGLNEEWETPCADGTTAFGKTGQCGGNTVHWTTVVDGDNATDGSTEDEIVNGTSAALKGADNQQIAFGSEDMTGYFYGKLLWHHFSSVRSPAGIAVVMAGVAK